MPILLIKNVPIICSKSEFLREYIKFDANYKSAFNNYEFDFYKSIKAILNVHEERNIKDIDDSGKRGRLDFYYLDEEAQELVFELVLFFSYFYGKFNVLFHGQKVSIKDFILPKKIQNSICNEWVVIKSKGSIFRIDAQNAKLLEGNVNHFVIYTETNIYYFSSTVYAKKGIEVYPNNGQKIFINRSEYILNSNRPSQRKLRRYRERSILVLIN